MAERLCKLCGAAVEERGLTHCPDCGAPLPPPPPEEEKEPLSPDGTPEEERPAEPAEKSRRSRKPWLVAALAGAAALAVALFFWLRGGPAGRPPDEQGRFVAQSADMAVLFTEEELPTVISRHGMVDISPTMRRASRQRASGDGAVVVYSNTGNYAGEYADLFGGSVLYDHGKLSRETFQDGWVTGNGRYLFFIESLGDDQARLRRRELATGQELTVDEGDIRAVADPGYDGSVVLYQRVAPGSDWPTLCRWTQRGIQDLGLRNIHEGYAKTATAEGMVFCLMGAEGTDISCWVGWPKADGSVAGGLRTIRTPYRMNRTGEEFLYQDENGRWFFETADGLQPLSDWGDMDPLTPMEGVGSLDHLTDWVYLVWTDDRVRLCYLTEALTVRELFGDERQSVLPWSDVRISPTGDRICYLYDGDLYEIDNARQADFTCRQLTQGGGVSGLFTDPTLTHLAIRTSQGSRCVKEEDGTFRIEAEETTAEETTAEGNEAVFLLRETGPVKVEAADSWWGVLKLMESGDLYFTKGPTAPDLWRQGPVYGSAASSSIGVGSSELFYLALGETEPRALGIQCGRAYHLGRDELLAVRQGEKGLQGWLLDGAGQVTALERTEFEG